MVVQSHLANRVPVSYRANDTWAVRVADKVDTYSEQEADEMGSVFLEKLSGVKIPDAPIGINYVVMQIDYSNVDPWQPSLNSLIYKYFEKAVGSKFAAEIVVRWCEALTFATFNPIVNITPCITDSMYVLGYDIEIDFDNMLIHIKTLDPEAVCCIKKSEMAILSYMLSCSLPHIKFDRPLIDLPIYKNRYYTHTNQIPFGTSVYKFVNAPKGQPVE